ncbi:MAG: MBL fold metallo-hydrolase [Deltaproteobacteria bacterium]|nr:MBL fold metallo-hydrolase [Deltaproteobacteria bacterium]
MTGVHEVCAVMGGFHLTGADMDAVIAPTTQALKALDPVYIIPTHLTLQDNYIDLTAQDNSDVVTRALPLKGLEVKNSILAEHGFSAVVTVTRDDVSHSILFDFGFSEHGAAFNADALGVDMTTVEAFALSHGHLDHVGGIDQLSQRVGKKGIDLVLHPTPSGIPAI